MIGRSEVFFTVERLIEKVAAYDAPVLIEDETGSGKELAAKAIHYRGLRRDHPFISVNCGALPELLIENELFGTSPGRLHGCARRPNRTRRFGSQRNAISRRNRRNVIQGPSGPPAVPAGLAISATWRKTGPAGRCTCLHVVAASNRSLEHEALAGRFRLDLFYRLKLMHIWLPPFRDRHGDISLLANHFMALASDRFGKPRKRFAAATLDWFERYQWPGNIRELEILVCREFHLSEGRDVDSGSPGVLVIDGRPVESGEVLNHKRAKALAIDQFESRFLTQVMGCAKGNVAAAARLRGTERRHLGRLLKKHEITPQASP